MLTSPAIPLPFTRESALRILECGARPEQSPYSHMQIAAWCNRFWCSYMETHASPEIEALLPILADVDIQWDLHLTNTYTIEELRSSSFEDEILPVEWFEEWLAQIKAWHVGPLSQSPSR